MSRKDETTPPDEVLCRQGSKGRTSLGEATIAGADVSTTGHVCGDARQGRAHKLRACLVCVQRFREVETQEWRTVRLQHTHGRGPRTWWP